MLDFFRKQGFPSNLSAEVLYCVAVSAGSDEFIAASVPLIYALDWFSLIFIACCFGFVSVWL